MKTYISVWPIDRKLQESLHIYDSGYVEAVDIGEILHTLARNGYINVNGFVEATENGERLSLHVTKNRR